MQRNIFKNKSLQEILIQGNLDLDALTESEEDELIKICSRNINQFKNCVNILLKDYITLLNPELLKIEDDISILSNNLLIEFSQFSLDMQVKMETMLAKIQLVKPFVAARNNLNKKIGQCLKNDLEAKSAKNKLECLQESLKRIENNEKNDLDVLEKKKQLNLEIELAFIECVKAEELVKFGQVEFEKAKEDLEFLENLPTAEVANIRSNSKDNISVYKAICQELTSTEDNIKSNLDEINELFSTISEECENMSSIADTFGIKKIQKRITLCIEIFGEIQLTSKFKKDDLLDYSDIAKSLAEFWYDEGVHLKIGKKLLPNEDVDNELIFEKNIEVLKLMFLTKPTNTLDILFKLCLVNITHYLTGLTHLDVQSYSDFSLEKLAIDLPDAYLKLFENLFYSENNFNTFITNHFDNKHFYLYYYYALFHLYAAIACQKSNNNHSIEKINDYMIIARESFLFCLENKIKLAKDILYKYFDDIPTDINITNIYFRKRNNKALDVSNNLYKQICHFSYDSIFKLHDINILLKNWANCSEIYLNNYVKDIIAQGIQAKEKVAYSLLEEIAYRNVNYLELLARNAIASGDLIKCDQAYNIALKYDDDIALFVQYLIKKEVYNDVTQEACRFLVHTISNGYKPAINELYTLVDSNCDYIKNILLELCNMSRINVTLLQYIKYFYINGFKLRHGDFSSTIERETYILSLYPSLLKTGNEEIEKLVIRDLYNKVRKSSTKEAFKILNKHAKFDRQTFALLLVDCAKRFAKYPNSKVAKYRFKKLEKIAKLYYLDNDSPEQLYFSYIRKCYVQKMKDTPLLLKICKLHYQPAVNELIEFTHDANNSKDKYFIDCKQTLNDISQSSIVAELLCIHYARQKLWSKANLYFQDLCVRLKRDKIALCKRLVEEKAISIFVENYDAEMYSLISPDEMNEIISDKYKHILAEKLYTIYLSRFKNENIIDLDLLTYANAYSNEFPSTIYESVDPIKLDIQDYKIKMNNVYYLAPHNQEICETFFHTLDDLHLYEITNGVFSHSLCIHFIKREHYEKAEFYFNLLSNSEEKLDYLCKQMLREKCFTHFEVKCSKACYEKIPGKYKASMNINRDSNKILFFQKTETQQGTQENEMLGLKLNLGLS